MNKIPTFIILFSLVVVLSGCTTEKPIGGERDGHGCLVPAGYSWNETINACIREWELNDNQRQAAKVAIAPLSYPVTILRVDVARCPGCFLVRIQRNDNQEEFGITLSNWAVVESPSEEVGMSPEDCLDLGGRTVNIVGGDTCNENEVNIGEVIGFISPNICCLPFEKLTYEEAKRIAEDSECTEKGQLTEEYFYNENTKTWWIDLEMKEEFEKHFCNPACVISEATKTAEINWRCTGGLPP